MYFYHFTAFDNHKNIFIKSRIFIFFIFSIFNNI